LGFASISAIKPPLLQENQDLAKFANKILDLNVIKNLWDVLESRIRLHTIISNEMLKVIVKEWNQITVMDGGKLVQSMQHGLNEFKKRKGYPIRRPFPKIHNFLCTHTFLIEDKAISYMFFML